MDPMKIERINELARKKKAGLLTEAEAIEQAALRKEYLAEWRAGAEQVLENTYIVDRNGVKKKLRKNLPWKTRV